MAELSAHDVEHDAGEPATCPEGLSREEFERRRAWLASIAEAREKTLRERGGEPVPQHLIDEALEEVRRGR